MSPQDMPPNGEENEDSPISTARGAAVSAETGPIDPELAAVIEGWPALPEAVRAGIVALVKSATS